MASPSEYSPVDHERFSARTQHVAQEGPSQPQTHPGTETDFAAVGGQFGDRRPSYPTHIEISEGEEPGPQPPSSLQAEAPPNASPGKGGRPSLGSPLTTPTPNRDHSAPYMRPSDLLITRQRLRRRWRGRRRNSGQHTQNSEDGSTELSDTTIEDPNGDRGDNERDRSTTPTPYFPPSYTPSQRSEETEEADYGEGRAPVSPDPFSAYSGHNLERIRNEIEGLKERIRGG